MIKKLNLTEFLSRTSIQDIPQTFQPVEYQNMSFNFSDFYKIVSTHTGSFIINENTYPSVISADTNLYFFKESTNDDYILLFDPIIDIKQKEINKFTVFYYPDQVINITLKKDINVKQETTSNGT